MFCMEGIGRRKPDRLDLGVGRKVLDAVVDLRPGKFAVEVVPDRGIDISPHDELDTGRDLHFPDHAGGTSPQANHPGFERSVRHLTPQSTSQS